MGGDGGSIPRRDDLVKSKKKQETASKDDANAALWKHCALTQDTLREPVVSCLLGRLYNKESVINKLLSKEKTPAVADHIRRLRDVRVLNLASYPIKTEGAPSTQESAVFFCPITKLDMSGRYPFIYLQKCGCVFSKKAILEVGDYKCMLCGTPYRNEEVILINPQSEEDVKVAQNRLLTSRKCAPKSKRQTNHLVPSKTSNSLTDNTVAEGDSDGDPQMKKIKLSSDNAITETATECNIAGGEIGASKSIQEDPSVSTVYKSLFTTSEEAKRQPKPHWVTFNPLYFR